MEEDFELARAMTRSAPIASLIEGHDQMETKTLKTIKNLRGAATAFEGFHAKYREKYAPDSRCDKKGYGFGKDDRFSAFTLNTHFSSWAGYYGNSSCQRILQVLDADVAHRFLIAALNEHQELIFATVARRMRAEAASLTEKASDEIEAMQKMLSDARADEAEGLNETGEQGLRS